ncbi:MAG: hypothetical protein ACJAV4_000921 [Pontimonas sp.]
MGAMENYSATSLGTAPEKERRSRMLKYTLAMALRLACIGACFLVSGWWLLLPALGAIVLPYFAVVLANSVTPSRSLGPTRPGTVTLLNSK